MSTRTLRPASSAIVVTRLVPRRLLLVRRSDANPFLGGFHSFPGGRHAREDGRLEGDESVYAASMIRCAARETFEEIGALIGFGGRAPELEEQRRARRDVLSGALEFWPQVERWGLTLEESAYRPCGLWITPHFGRARFRTTFFLVEVDEPFALDVWPGELSGAEWVDPVDALRLWERDEMSLAMPTLHAIRVLAEAWDDIAARLAAVPEAKGVPSRFVHVRPGITMVPLRSETIPPATHTNAVVVGRGDVVLIDPGSADPSELESLYEAVGGAIGTSGRVRAILLTHHHGDHIAGVEAVRRRYGAPVWAHPRVAARVRLDRELREDDVIDLPGPPERRLRVLAAPGHARSHLVYLEETSRTLITGDVVSGLGTVVIAPPEGNLVDYLATLERLKALGASTLVPGHGAPHRGVERVLHVLIEHRRMREGRILRALAAGPLEETALRDRVYEDTPGADPDLALKTLRAHVEKLVVEGIAVTRGTTVALAPRPPA